MQKYKILLTRPKTVHGNIRVAVGKSTFFSQNEIFFKKIILFFGTIATNHYLWGVLIIIW